MAVFFATAANAGEMRLIVSAPVGGDYDILARLVARHLGKHLWGQPAVVVENRQTASGRGAANYLFNEAPRDGSVIGLLNQQTVFWQAVGDPGVKYDASQMTWLGSPFINDAVLAVSRDSGVRTIEDARAKITRMGAATRFSAQAMYPLLSNAFLGTRFEVITGYSGSHQIKLAVERGEIDGIGQRGWGEWQADAPEWVRSGKIVPLFHTGLVKADGLEYVPRMVDLAIDSEGREALEMVSILSMISRPFVAPPEAPAAALRDAFDATMKDRAFLAEAERLKIGVKPVSGERLTTEVRRLLSTPTQTVERVKSAL